MDKRSPQRAVQASAPGRALHRRAVHRRAVHSTPYGTHHHTGTPYGTHHHTGTPSHGGLTDGLTMPHYVLMVCGMVALLSGLSTGVVAMMAMGMITAAGFIALAMAWDTIYGGE